MKSNVLSVVTVAGSCAFLYMLYRLKFFSKKKSLESEEMGKSNKNQLSDTKKEACDLQETVSYNLFDDKCILNNSNTEEFRTMEITLNENNSIHSSTIEDQSNFDESEVLLSSKIFNKSKDIISTEIDDSIKSFQSELSSSNLKLIELNNISPKLELTAKDNNNVSRTNKNNEIKSCSSPMNSTKIQQELISSDHVEVLSKIINLNNSSPIKMQNLDESKITAVEFINRDLEISNSDKKYSDTINFANLNSFESELVKDNKFKTCTTSDTSEDAKCSILGSIENSVKTCSFTKIINPETNASKLINCRVIHCSSENFSTEYTDSSNTGIIKSSNSKLLCPKLTEHSESILIEAQPDLLLKKVNAELVHSKIIVNSNSEIISNIAEDKVTELIKQESNSNSKPEILENYQVNEIIKSSNCDSVSIKSCNSKIKTIEINVNSNCDLDNIDISHSKLNKLESEKLHNSTKLTEENLNSELLNSKSECVDFLKKKGRSKKKSGNKSKSIQNITKPEEPSQKLEVIKNDSVVENLETNPSKPIKKSKRQKQREKKKAAQSKNKENISENTDESNFQKSDSTVNDATIENCDTSDTAVKAEVSLENSNRNLELQDQTLVGDQGCTSDLEREASKSPEQENITSDAQSLISQASVDSGQGSIEVEHDTATKYTVSEDMSESSQEALISYHFEVPQFLVGRLIGRKGSFISKIKAATSTKIVLVNHANKEFKLCTIEGFSSQVMEALDLIKEHFPSDKFPDLNLTQVNIAPPFNQVPIVNRRYMQLEIPPGVVVEVHVSSVMSTGELWVQQPIHPTFSPLESLHACMNANYGDGSTSPQLPETIPNSTICVCHMNGQWLRCEVNDHNETHACVTLLDIGGKINLPRTSLRQIRVDYAALPFQASMCYLYGIEPCKESGWEEAGRQQLLELVRNNMLYAVVAAYSEDSIPLVNLFHRHDNHQYTDINQKMIELGHAKRISSEKMQPV